MEQTELALTFPNRARYFDKRRNAVCFDAFDGLFGIPFCVDAKALSQSDEESRILTAFDSGREKIQSAAKEAYSNDRKTVYVLTSKDLR